MMLRRLVVSIGVALLAATCAGSDETPAGSPDAAVASSTTAVPDPVATTPEPAGGGEWVTTRPTFDDGGVASVEGVTMDVVAIAAAGDAYFATGDIVGIPVIWRSADLEHFEVVYLDERTSGMSRWMRLESITSFGDRVVVGGSGQQREGAGERIDRSFLFVSDDGGETWAEVEDPLFGEPFQRLDRLVAAGDALLIDLVDDECCGQPRWQPHRSIDLVEFDPVVLPGADDDAWGTFVDDGLGTTFAIESRWDDVGPRLIVWSSIDGAQSWDRVELPVGGGRGIAPVAGGLTILPDYGYGEVGPETLDVLAPSRIVGAEVTTLEPDVGQWGDDTARLTGQTMRGSGRFYGVLRRQLRANPHYCFENIETCHDYEAALVTSSDGIEWFDLEHPGPEPFGQAELFATVDGHVALWRHPRDEAVEIEYWRGPDVPATVDPPGYDPPAVPVAMYDREEGLPIGTERRFAWGLGGCGGMYIDEISWVPETQPDTTGWPIEEVQIEDGPSGYAYGRVLRVADDLIEFSIEGTEIVVPFAPHADDPEAVCG